MSYGECPGGCFDEVPGIAVLVARPVFPGLVLVPPPSQHGQRHGQQPVSGTADPRSSQTGHVIRGLR